MLFLSFSQIKISVHFVINENRSFYVANPIFLSYTDKFFSLVYIEKKSLPVGGCFIFFEKYSLISEVVMDI